MTTATTAAITTTTVAAPTTASPVPAPTADALRARATASLTADEARVLYPDHITVREARERYFERAGFDDKTYTDVWMELPVGPFTVKAPNFEGRKRAVKVHDINHVLGGYGTDWDGEFHVSAYELGAGMGSSTAGWLFNAGGVMAGLVLSHRSVVAAFARGRAQRRSLYVEMFPFREEILDKTVGELRAHLGVVDQATPTPKDVLHAWLHGIGGLLAFSVPPVVAAAAMVAVGWWVQQQLS